jgi:hypothetical protein
MRSKTPVVFGQNNQDEIKELMMVADLKFIPF